MLNQNKVNQSFWLLERYLNSWQGKDGAISGIIATFWDYTRDTIIPHTMNNYPLILGYINLWNKFHNVLYLKKAKTLAQFYLLNQSSDGQYLNAWGDIPPKHTGPILQICPDISLLELYKLTGDRQYLETVNKNLAWLFKIWWEKKIFRGGVVNQNAKAVELFLSMYDITQQIRYKNLALTIGSWILTQQNKDNRLTKGGFYQSSHDDRFILVYNAKIIPSLVKLYKLTQEARYKIALDNLVQFILNNQSQYDLFRSYIDFDINPVSKFFISRMYKTTKFTPFLRNKLRMFKRVYVPYRVYSYPIWIARSADIINSLLIAKRVTKVDQNTLDQLIMDLLSFQYENGGFPNTVGYFGNPNTTVWQDVVCSTRWNAYCFDLLSKLTSKQLKLPRVSYVQKKYYNKRNIGLFIETDSYVEWRENKKTIKRFYKKNVIKMDN